MLESGISRKPGGPLYVVHRLLLVFPSKDLSVRRSFMQTKAILGRHYG